MDARKKEINLLTVLCCFMVITIHLTSGTLSQFNNSSWQYVIIFIPYKTASFAVYGFIFISAMKLSMAKYQGYRHFIIKRFKKVIVPYLIAVTLFWIYFALFFNYSFSINQIIQYYVFGNICAHFYFVIIITQFYLLFPVWRWLSDRVEAIMVIPFALLLMIIFWDSSYVFLSRFMPSVDMKYFDRLFFTYSAFWLAGFYSGKHYDAFIRMIKKTRKVFLFSSQ